jgi:ubiquinone/menaquinone biosynthesis C-methylase UbiE
MATTAQVLDRPTPAPGLATTVFQEEWQVYRKMVDNNYLFHNEAYDVLRRWLLANASAPFRFLDLACGDASASVAALKGTAVAHYQGVDLSEPALDLARDALKALPCTVALERHDFAAALEAREKSADVAWIGLSLHHYRTPDKLRLMRSVREIVGASGAFLIYENASPGEETREAWMTRWDLQRPDWHSFSDAEWNTITDHVHDNDFPETDATWHTLGTSAGFTDVRRLYVCPTDLFRLYCFKP